MTPEQRRLRSQIGRVVRLADLTAEQRHLIRALVAAARESAAPEPSPAEASAATPTEGLRLAD